MTIAFFDVFLSSLGGYAFARLQFPGREVLFILVLSTLMIPDQLRLVPVFQMLTSFPLIHYNFVGTYEGYILIKLVSPRTCSSCGSTSSRSRRTSRRRPGSTAPVSSRRTSG